MISSSLSRGPGDVWSKIIWEDCEVTMNIARIDKEFTAELRYSVRRVTVTPEVHETLQTVFVVPSTFDHAQVMTAAIVALEVEEAKRAV